MVLCVLPKRHGVRRRGWRRGETRIPARRATGAAAAAMVLLMVIPACQGWAETRGESIHDAPARTSGNWSSPTNRTAELWRRSVCIERPPFCCPVGTIENRAAFQRWAGRQEVASSEGTAEVQSHAESFSRPFGTCVPCGTFPGVKTPGYSQAVPPGLRNLSKASVVAGGTNNRATLAIEGVAPLYAARTSQRDVPTWLNRNLH